MKRFLITIYLVISAIGIYAQNATINKLKSRLHAAKNDSATVLILDSLSMYNMFFYHGSDSTLNYCNEYINTAFRLPDKRYIILAYARLSFYYSNVGQYKESLSAALKGLNLAEQYHNKDYLSALYYDLTWSYNNLNDNAEALKNALRGISYLKQDKDPFFDEAVHLYGITGLCYQDLGKADSALFYYKKMSSAVSASKELSAKAVANWHWTLYYLFDTKQYEKADSSIADGIKECLATGNFLLEAFYSFSANSALSQHKFDRAVLQAKTGYKFSVYVNDPGAQIYAAELLESAYEKLKKRDSAFRYLKIQDSLSQVIQMHSNALDIQQLQFDQQLNKKEQAAASAIHEQRQRSKTLVYVFVTAVAFLLVILNIQWRNSNQKRKANETLLQQKEKVESTLTELKSAQAQLIQREKMASLGELTAGIAHEIQNPLNFVNNFSEVNNELIDELRTQKSELKSEEQDELLNDILQNNEKIVLHGKRADAIVKGMLEHSKKTTGVKEPTAVNSLCNECLRLSYQALRAKDKSFYADLKNDFDESIGKIGIIPPEMGRVFMNLCNNAFYAVNEKKKIAGADYKPIVSVTTKKISDGVEIRVYDNGIGIQQNIIEKIFQPFFTTKPTGQGTGLGLSLAYDIITKEHNGTIRAESQEDEGSVFIITLPAF